MRHTYECPLRWADMDMLQHVNNVVYVDYLQEARADLYASHAELQRPADDAGDEGLVVVRHELDFLRPLHFRHQPVLVDTWVTQVGGASFTLAHEVYDETASGRVVYLRASSRLAPYSQETGLPRRLADVEKAFLETYREPAVPRPPLSREGSSTHVYPLRVRWSDLDPNRHVNNVKFVEYFQEARVGWMSALAEPGDEPAHVAVARIDLDYRRPMLFRQAPYDVHSWVSHVGTSSFTVAGEIRDGAEVLATSEVVLVAFDPVSQTSAPMAEVYRTRLQEQLALAATPRS